MAVTKQELEAENAELKAQLAAQPEAAEIGQVAGPHVLSAIQKILGVLGVKKSGVLPANMGGKPYISAVDLNYAVKELFVQEKLVLVPREQVKNFEVIDGQRKQTFMVIEGTYQIISSVDGSNVTIGGVGDGSAIGSAVTANIASTNALKNALLRFFLVTEQSAEDAAKETPGAADGAAAPAGDRAQQAAQRAGQQQSAVPQPVVTQAPNPARQEILTKYIQPENSPYTRDQINALTDKIKAEGGFEGSDKLYPEVLRRLDNGELA